MTRSRPTSCYALFLWSFILATAAGAQMMPGPFDRNWDWRNNRRMLTFCTDPNLPQMLSTAAQFAATQLSNTGSGWMLNHVGNCPANWDLRRPAMNQPDLRVTFADLGPVMVAGGGGPYPPYPHDYESEGEKPSPDRVPPRGRHPQFFRPPLAYFQPGPFAPGGGRWIRAGEVVFNWKAPAGGGNDPKWNTQVGSAAFDPKEVAMHELGHAVRLDHDDHLFNDDLEDHPPGSLPGINVITLRPGANGNLDNMVCNGDLQVGQQISSGNDGDTDSGKKTNVMSTFAVRGRHGINPCDGVPAASTYRYTAREVATATAAANHRPAMPGAGMQLGAGPGRFQSWLELTLYDAADQPVASYFPGLTGDGADFDVIEPWVPPAVRYEGTVDVDSHELPGLTSVTVRGNLGAVPGETRTHVQILVPFSPDHPQLIVEADWAADVVTISDGVTALCSGALSDFLPVDCSPDPDNPNFFDLGFVTVELTDAPPDPEPEPDPGPTPDPGPEPQPDPIPPPGSP